MIHNDKDDYDNLELEGPDGPSYITCDNIEYDDKDDENNDDDDDDDDIYFHRVPMDAATSPSPSLVRPTPLAGGNSINS